MSEPRICKLVPFSLLAAEQPVYAIVHTDGRLQKFVIWHQGEELAELYTNN